MKRSHARESSRGVTNVIYKTCLTGIQIAGDAQRQNNRQLLCVRIPSIIQQREALFRDPECGDHGTLDLLQNLLRLLGSRGPPLENWELPLFLDPALEVPLSAEIGEAICTFIHTELEQQYMAYQDCGAVIAGVK